MALRVYERYLRAEVFSATTLVLVAFLMLFGFFDLIGEVRDIGRGSYQLAEAVMFVSLTLPGRLYELAPIAVLIGTLYALTSLARHSEITVLRASGLSNTAMLGALLKLGLIFVVMTFVVGEFVAPVAERTAQQIRLRSISAVVAQEFRSGVWLRDDRAFVNIRDVTPEGSLESVRVYQFDDRFRLLSIVDAKTADFVGDGAWKMSEVTETGFESTRSTVVREESRTWKTAINPDMLSVLMVAPEKMQLATLYQYVHHLSDNKQKTERYEIAFWKKLIYPLSILVMMVLALPFAFLQGRSGGVSLKVFAGIMLGIGFHLLNGLFTSLGAINEWRPVVAAITPSVLFLLGAGGMIYWVERR